MGSPSTNPVQHYLVVFRKINIGILPKFWYHVYNSRKWCAFNRHLLFLYRIDQREFGGGNVYIYVNVETLCWAVTTCVVYYHIMLSNSKDHEPNSNWRQTSEICWKLLQVTENKFCDSLKNLLRNSDFKDFSKTLSHGILRIKPISGHVSSIILILDVFFSTDLPSWRITHLSKMLLVKNVHWNVYVFTKCWDVLITS